jgi:peptidyl-tRNA hydrolase
MEVQIGSIKFHMRQTKSEIFKISDLKRRGVISAEICEVFEEAERQRIKRKRKDNILEWWLGWSNHRQLLKVFRETRMQNRLKQVHPLSRQRKEIQLTLEK